MLQARTSVYIGFAKFDVEITRNTIRTTSHPPLIAISARLVTICPTSPRRKHLPKKNEFPENILVVLTSLFAKSSTLQPVKVPSSVSW